MADSVFEIFGNHVRKPKDNNYRAINKRRDVENLETFFPTCQNTGPLKPQEVSSKKSEFFEKKSFLNNKGASFQVTPFKSLTPRSVNRQSLLDKTPLKIYSDTGLIPEKTPVVEEELDYLTEIEFTKPPVIYDNFDEDIFDGAYYMDSDIDPIVLSMPVCYTPSPKVEAAVMTECEDCDDGFLTDEILNEDIAIDCLDLPPMY